MRLKHKSYRNWHRWFAWYPVKCDDLPGCYVWMEPVWRINGYLPFGTIARYQKEINPTRPK